jgi:hypothetical protein
MAASSSSPPEELISPIADLAVGIAGCVVCVQVVDEDEIRSITSKDIYKGLWVVADAKGTTIDVDAWDRDRSKLEELASKLSLGATVIIEGFQVREQTNKRQAPRITHITVLNVCCVRKTQHNCFKKPGLNKNAILQSETPPVGCLSKTVSFEKRLLQMCSRMIFTSTLCATQILRLREQPSSPFDQGRKNHAG